MSIGAAAGDGLLRGIFEGCIAGGDAEIQRRPYHKNCKCALHRSTRGPQCAAAQPCNRVSYPIRRTWSEGCLAMMPATATEDATPSRSPVAHALPPAGKITRTRTQLVLCEEKDEEGDQVSWF